MSKQMICFLDINVFLSKKGFYCLKKINTDSGNIIVIPGRKKTPVTLSLQDFSEHETAVKVLL